MTTTRSRAWGRVIKIVCAGGILLCQGVHANQACNAAFDQCLKTGASKIAETQRAVEKECDRWVINMGGGDAVMDLQQGGREQRNRQQAKDACLAGAATHPNVQSIRKQIDDTCNSQRTTCLTKKPTQTRSYGNQGE